MMKELFVSSLCPDCETLLNAQRVPNVEGSIEWIDITQSMSNLKRFLRYRDQLEAFVPIREEGRVGIPVLIVDEKQVEFLG